MAKLLYNVFKTHALAREWYLERPLIMFSHQEDGFVDPLDDRDGETGMIPQGITTISIRFDKPVFDLTTGGPLVIGSFAVTSTGGSPPTVTAVVPGPAVPDQYTLTLSGPIEPGEWTTFLPLVKDGDGNPLRSDPWDQVDLGFLPGDTTADGTVTMADYDRLVEVLLGQHPEDLSLHDVNRDGDVTTADRGRLLELFAGTETTRAWLNYSLPARP